MCAQSVCSPPCSAGLSGTAGAEPPFIIYSATADYLPDGGLGDYSYFGEGTEDYVEARTEQPSATFSFTACSINRSYTDDDGNPVTIFGADEALELATLAQGFFLHGGLDDIRKAGFVVVEVTNAGEPRTPWSWTKWGGAMA